MSDKFNDIVSKIESMSVLDLSELVKVLEEKFGVSAAAPMMMAAMPMSETYSFRKAIPLRLTGAGSAASVTPPVQVLRARGA